MLSLNKICKRYGAVSALQGVDLSISEGEIFGLVGPDGSGKTSLFRIMATLLLPDGGTCRVDGLDAVRDYREIRRRIGYMPGNFSLYQDLTVAENLQFFATAFGASIAANYSLIADIYDQLKPFENRRAGKLSGGMKQKLALSCALIHAPRLLLLDEPTTGVDPVSRREFWAMLHRLRSERGITIVAATPYRDEVLQCDRIALMEAGRVMAVGSPAEVLPPEAGIEAERPSLATAPSVIEAEGLTKRFGDFVAVDHISFKVKRGEIFGFLGANGAGKTTAMQMLCGLSRPTEGRAVVAGVDVMAHPEEVKRRIGYMSQKFSLYDDLTVRENLQLFGGIYGLSRGEVRRRSDELLARLELTAQAGTCVGELPLGWKQKLAFSVATFHEPKIVFLDEPTGGVDAETRRRFWVQIHEAAARGMTVFVTTHYMDEADYCDRVSMMVDGTIRALDTPERLKQQCGVATMHDVFLHLARGAQRGQG